MKISFHFQNIPLFHGITEEDLSAMLSCISARKQHYKKNQAIHVAGSPTFRVGIVLSGAVRVISEDFKGNPSLLAEVDPGDLFGETYACAQLEKLPVTIISAAESNVLFIDYKRIITTCTSSCPFHAKVIENMLQILADKNIMLNEKIQVMAKRTTREKLFAYLYGQAKKNGSSTFTIPFNRKELANYLCMDRSDF